MLTEWPLQPFINDSGIRAVWPPDVGSMLGSHCLQRASNGIEVPRHGVRVSKTLNDHIAPLSRPGIGHWG